MKKPSASVNLSDTNPGRLLLVWILPILAISTGTRGIIVGETRLRDITISGTPGFLYALAFLIFGIATIAMPRRDEIRGFHQLRLWTGFLVPPILIAIGAVLML